MRKSFIEKVESHCCDDSGKLEFHCCDNSVGLAVAMTLPALVLAVAMHSFSLAVPAVAVHSFSVPLLAAAVLVALPSSFEPLVGSQNQAHRSDRTESGDLCSICLA